jgi:hypothetical protein
MELNWWGELALVGEGWTKQTKQRVSTLSDVIVNIFLFLMKTGDNLSICVSVLPNFSSPTARSAEGLLQ